MTRGPAAPGAGVPRPAVAGPRLYLVTPPVLTEAAMRALEALLGRFDVACVRLASAASRDAEIRRDADRLRELCHPRDVSLVLTDHFRLAPGLGLDGVHLTAGARLVREARRHLGADAIVGAFAGASRHEGMNAAEAGADYVAFGPVADTALGDGSVAGAELFAWWSEIIETPVVAEGGFTAALAGGIGAHADFIALGAELWDDPAGPLAAAGRILGGLPG